MIKVLFVCLGNICRSPMAEFLLKHKVKGKIDNILIDSAGTSGCESGSDMHNGSKRELRRNGIEFERHCARKINISDYDKYDYIIYMDKSNLTSLERIFSHDNENKLYSLMSFAGLDSDVADPWYTGDFEKTFSDIDMALDGFINYISNKEQ